MASKCIINVALVLVVAATVQLMGQQVSDQPVAATGCLHRADAIQANQTVGTTGTVGGEQFILTDPRVGPPTASTSSDVSTPSDAAPNETKANSDTTSSAARPHRTKGPWYSVTGDANTLHRGIDHQVEITGTLNTIGSVIGTSASVTAGPSGTIHVTAIKVLGACAR